MDKFLSAARDFDQQARRPINRYDLGVALLLEYFAFPLLWMTSYTPIKSRSVITPAAADLHELSNVAPPIVIDRLVRDNTDKMDDLKEDYPEFSEALTLIGHGLDEHRRAIESANRISRTLAVAVIVLYLAIPVAFIRALLIADLRRLSILGGVWLVALLSATIACRFNLHWRPRAGFRGSSR